MDQATIDRTRGEAIEAAIRTKLVTYVSVNSLVLPELGDLIETISKGVTEQLQLLEQIGATHEILILPALNEPAIGEAIILCVRTSASTITDEVVIPFRQLYPGHNIKLQYVNPRTPEELDDMTRWPNVAAVFLQEQPLPRIVLQRMETPCVLLREGKLMQLTQITPSLQPFEVSIAAKS